MQPSGCHFCMLSSTTTMAIPRFRIFHTNDERFYGIKQPDIGLQSSHSIAEVGKNRADPQRLNCDERAGRVLSTRAGQRISGTSDVTPGYASKPGYSRTIGARCWADSCLRRPPCIRSVRTEHRSRVLIPIRDPLVLYLSLSSWYAGTKTVQAVPTCCVEDLDPSHLLARKVESKI